MLVDCGFQYTNQNPLSTASSLWMMCSAHYVLGCIAPYHRTWSTPARSRNLPLPCIPSDPDFNTLAPALA
jgi:hypothetical protein